MVLLTMTASIVEALEKFSGASNDDATERDDANSSTGNQDPSLRGPAVGNPIAHGQIIDIWKRSRSEGHGTRLEDLLRGATIYIPPPPPKPEPTHEYKALMARLRREQEQRSYERMLQKAPPRESFAQRFPLAPLAASFAEVNRPSNPSDLGEDIENGDIQRQITLIINFLVSIFGCGAALWIAARWWSVPARLFLSLGGSLVVAIAEVAVYSAFTWRAAEGEKSRKNIREVKQVVQTWVVGEDDIGNKSEKDLLDVSIGSSDPDSNLRRRFKDMR
ncbi:endoplasmic reticulum-based factor for assembly of V-ATPase-domain-containing protein [Durotheca rogersii]|uniref:endoplasmic reticulum-based factor for assembly of V-ATPase-domain-containing protein n=1 Tax=Durotheca rogersii TaxID=419775 RepID=UPI00221F5868|nr:endoplasmic reticulum-based factor for assembly of V-ATPase-domain-containing protein [Durotheca rogersii]KAI5863837.1 endoplasmic reticulum-based factor for assembly of V-ATPase-domain-containing protein [Durotheca rogersii]